MTIKIKILLTSGINIVSPRDIIDYLLLRLIKVKFQVFMGLHLMQRTSFKSLLIVDLHIFVHFFVSKPIERKANKDHFHNDQIKKYLWIAPAIL